MGGLSLQRRFAQKRWAFACLAVFVAVRAGALRGDETSASTNAAPAGLSIEGNDAATAPTPPLTLPSITLTNAAPLPELERAPAMNNPPGFNPGILTNVPGGIPPASYSPSPSKSWPDDLAAHLLVVYNENDPDSRTLAEYYATRRGIPAERIFGLTCPLTEEISRKDYDESIRSPIVTYLAGKDWLVREPHDVRVGDRVLNLLTATRNDIWAIVLMRGVPLKIAADPDDYFGMQIAPEYQTNAAAVDSELALLPVFGLPLGGYVPNVFYEGEFGGIREVGAELARKIVLVTRLDGPSPADVRRMIDDTLSAEKHRLAGLAVVDTQGLTDPASGYTPGDDWLRGARDALVSDGWAVRFDDRPAVLPASDPLNHVAIYLGWYAGDAQGPWVTPPDRFVPGAIAYHLHSFGASTVRSSTRGWAGPLIAHGAAATMGTVYEPYLSFTPHEDIFTRRLLAGDYFAAAAYASERGLSWMVTVIGDPLYRPFRAPLDTTQREDAGGPHSSHADWLLLQRVQRQLHHGGLANNRTSIQAALDVPGAGPVLHEGLADLLAEMKDSQAVPPAEREYAKAAAADTAPIDRIRVGLKLSRLYEAHGDPDNAHAQLDILRDLFPDDAARFGVPAPPARTAGAPGLPPSHDTPPVTSSTTAGPPKLPQLPQLAKPTPATP